MSDGIVIALIVAVPPTIVGIGGVVIGVLSWKTSNANKGKIEDVHGLVNSRMTELLELTRKASKAEGVKSVHERDAH